MRRPYVGKGADGARRSAQVDRDELATLGLDHPRRETLEQSIAEWEAQAAALDEAGEWLRSRPEAIQRVAREFPPGCTVRTKPGVILLVPAPGVDGDVVSYYEDGHLGVAAPLSIPHPEHGWGDAEPGERAQAHVDPDLLELRGEPALTRADVAAMLEGPA